MSGKQEDQVFESGGDSIVGEQDPVMEAVRKAIDELRFGFISLTVHDAKVVQIEVTEKRRF